MCEVWKQTVPRFLPFSQTEIQLNRVERILFPHLFFIQWEYCSQRRSTITLSNWYSKTFVIEKCKAIAAFLTSHRQMNAEAFDHYALVFHIVCSLRCMAKFPKKKTFKIYSKAWTSTKRLDSFFLGKCQRKRIATLNHFMATKNLQNLYERTKKLK